MGEGEKGRVLKTTQQPNAQINPKTKLLTPLQTTQTQQNNRNTPTTLNSIQNNIQLIKLTRKQNAKPDKRKRRASLLAQTLYNQIVQSL